MGWLDWFSSSSADTPAKQTYVPLVPNLQQEGASENVPAIRVPVESNPLLSRELPVLGGKNDTFIGEFMGYPRSVTLEQLKEAGVIQNANLSETFVRGVTIQGGGLQNVANITEARAWAANSIMQYFTCPQDMLGACMNPSTQTQFACHLSSAFFSLNNPNPSAQQCAAFSDSLQDIFGKQCTLQNAILGWGVMSNREQIQHATAFLVFAGNPQHPLTIQWMYEKEFVKTIGTQLMNAGAPNPYAPRKFPKEAQEAMVVHQAQIQLLAYLTYMTISWVFQRFGLLGTEANSTKAGRFLQGLLSTLLSTTCAFLWLLFQKERPKDVVINTPEDWLGMLSYYAGGLLQSALLFPFQIGNFIINTLAEAISLNPVVANLLGQFFMETSMQVVLAAIYIATSTIGRLILRLLGFWTPKVTPSFDIWQLISLLLSSMFSFTIRFVFLRSLDTLNVNYFVLAGTATGFQAYYMFAASVLLQTIILTVVNMLVEYTLNKFESYKQHKLRSRHEQQMQEEEYKHELKKQKGEHEIELAKLEAIRARIQEGVIEVVRPQGFWQRLWTVFVPTKRVLQATPRAIKTKDDGEEIELQEENPKGKAGSEREAENTWEQQMENMLRSKVTEQTLHPTCDIAILMYTLGLGDESMWVCRAFTPYPQSKLHRDRLAKISSKLQQNETYTTDQIDRLKETIREFEGVATDIERDRHSQWWYLSFNDLKDKRQRVTVTEIPTSDSETGDDANDRQRLVDACQELETALDDLIKSLKKLSGKRG